MKVVNDGPAQQMMQHRASVPCWCCNKAPPALQTEKKRDGLCAACRRRVEDFWTGRRLPKRKVA